ncbi:hypothetical protein QBC39DRAFT_264946 [Podospora conica]|nr:hypothetical protein QBC39DRAFT_264946 [Schizothecium conicum]
MLRDHLGIDESNILRPDAPERERDAKWLKSPRRDLLQELDLANWEPDRLGWSRKWRPDEVESEWVQRFYSHLFLRLKEFVTVNFGLGDLEDMDPPVWVTRDFSQHLVHYAQIVARQDNRVGGWDELLYSNRPRQYLIMGIIGRMLQTHVFDELLFGGDYSAKAILRTQDQGLVTLEGFQRTDLRGRTVKAILGEESLPTRFWDAVDVLTTKITTTLLPLFDLMDEHFPDRRFVSLRGIYQDLHYIVAEAGFLSLTLRESKDIFRFTWPVPGQAWDLEQDNHDDDVYQASLNENRRLYEEHQRQQHQQEEEDQPSPTSSTSEMFHTPPSSPATAMRFQFLRNLTSRPAPPPPAAPLPDPATQIAKVHIVLWPQLQRFSTPTPQWMEPPNRPDEWFLDPGRQFITEIARARVVYYLGSTDPVAEQAERRPALAEHIASHRSRRGFSPSTAVVVRSLWMLVYVLAAVGAAAALATYFDGTVGFVLGYVRELGFAVLDVFVGAVMGVTNRAKPPLDPPTHPTMDASALLKSQGWRGTGFSLHPTDNAIGLARPLLISRNTDGRGVGQKPHHTSDQWWLHAFDQKLKGLDTSKKGAVTQAVTQGKLDVVAAGKPGGKYTGSAGLYASFVRGETMVGSLTLPREETATPTEGSEGGETKGERKARREVRRAVKEREKERERARRRKEEEKAARRAGKLAGKQGGETTKAERKARRAERRARKEARRKRREAKGRV